jgi:two-component system, LytTR family, response regulator
MVKILLVDDERKATDSLRLMLERLVPGDQQIESCNDARKAAARIHQFNPDLLFLDIRMPHFSGFEVLESVFQKNFKVIFTTAYDEYAIRAIRFSAFDYLLKPIDAEELMQVWKRFEQGRLEPVSPAALFTNITHNLNLQLHNQFRLALPFRDGVYFLYPHEIIRCEAMSAYTKFYTHNNRQLVSSRNLGEYEELLSAYQFIRTHKSHLVNKTFISYLDHEGFVILKDGTKVEVSRRRKEEVMELLKA